MKNNHSFHLVDVSPWPLLGAFSVFSMLMGLTKWFHQFNNDLMIISMLTTLMIMYQWWRDVTRESSFLGLHSSFVSKGLRWGMILFITSEIFFFLSFFWGFFHSSLTPSIELGMLWPPQNILTFNPTQIPLLNTLILISSGVTVTWTHHSIMENNFTQAKMGLILTIILGVYFTILQGYEYLNSSFTMADSVYGSSFFMATGFHGLHVIIGTIFLFTCYLRLLNIHFSKINHFGFEAAAWYWHFVDVVWLFLYLSIYWWGS